MNLDFMASRPTLGEEQQRRRATPKDQIRTRLEEKDEKTKDSDRAWDACKKAVDLRDGRKCRKCKCRTQATLELVRNRAEHHHIVRRKKEPKLLTDVRNVVLLCHECHRKVTARRLHIVGKAVDMFLLDGKNYLNAAKPLQFVEWKKEKAS